MWLMKDGWISCAAELLRYRKGIQAENVLVYTDIKKKHASHAITWDLDIEDLAKGAEFFPKRWFDINGGLYWNASLK